MARLEGTYEQIDRRLEAFEARVDSRFNGLESRMDARFEAQASRLDGIQRRMTALIVATWTTTLLAMLGLYVKH